MPCPDFSELDKAASRVVVGDHGYRSAWARRWLWGIDRSQEGARKFSRMDTPSGLLAAAALLLLEAQELGAKESEWDFEKKLQYESKEEEAARLISGAIALLELKGEEEP